MLPDAPPPAGDSLPAATEATTNELPEGGPLATGTLPGPVPTPVGRVAGRRSRGTMLLGLAIVLVTVLSGSALFASGFLLGQRQATQPGTPPDQAAAFQPFWDVYAAIRDRYALGPVDQKTLIEGAIKGMVTAVGDPYSTYLTSAEFRSTLQDISGELEGIGAEIGTVDAKGATSDCSTFGPDCQLVVVAPLSGSPAEKAGLKPGDIISKVDGATLVGLTSDQARDKIRGKKGTDVVLTILRGTAAPFDVSITRDVVKQKEVITKDLADGTIAYVRLTGFSDNGAADFVKAIQAAIDRGETRIIVDLRGNPGGFVTAARTVAGTFIKDGPVFWEEDAQGNLTPTNADGKGIATDPKYHVAVLIDKGSASASEIVAGALQDTKRATLIGQTSYGKGTVQTWIELDNDAGGVKLTVAKWLTPDKRWIHRIGLTPDVAVTVPANSPAGQDPVLDKAVEVLSGAGTSDAFVPLRRAA
ncbi:MAG: S41 family peptidase [Chloroflexi bacterium]|nr:S41 family peptidase [Chloroflexota bacterium]